LSSEIFDDFSDFGVGSQKFHVVTSALDAISCVDKISHLFKNFRISIDMDNCTFFFVYFEEFF
jgi:hypothetical protein